MRCFKSCLLVTAASLGILVAACSDSGAQPSAPSFDRAAAVARIEARLAEYDAWRAQYRPLSSREKAGEDVGAELDAMKAAKPGFTDLVTDAERIVQANPADDAAFEAIWVALRGNSMKDKSQWKGSVNEARQQRLQRVLLAHHIQRPDFLKALYLNFSDPQAHIDFWKQVLERSPHAHVRVEAARKVMKRYAEWAQETQGEVERDAMHAQVRHYANLIKSEFPDEVAYVSDANGYLAALEHSSGTKLADVEVRTLAGGTDSLSHYRGKVVLLDFWATWCGPCRRDHPKLIALKQELRGRAFEIISVSADEKPEMVTRYLSKERDLPWPQWYVGPKGALLNQWGIQGYPTYLLVDGAGTLQARGSTLILGDLMDHARRLSAQIERR